jgi:hypothetical protein
MKSKKLCSYCNTPMRTKHPIVRTCNRQSRLLKAYAGALGDIRDIIWDEELVWGETTNAIIEILDDVKFTAPPSKDTQEGVQ